MPAFGAVHARLGLIATLFVLAAVAWWATADRMRGMDDGPGSDLGALGWFLGVWAVMMAAMMLPLIALEKTVPWGRAATYGTAALLLILAVALLADPAAIPGLTIPGGDAMSGMATAGR